MKPLSGETNPRPYSPPDPEPVALPTPRPPRRPLKTPDGRGLAVTHAEEAELQELGAAEQCGALDPGCHGGLRCTRAVHPDEAPHAGPDETGQLVQWAGPCPPPVDPDGARLDAQHRAAVAAERAEVAAAVIDAIVQHRRDTGRLPWE